VLQEKTWPVKEGNKDEGTAVETQKKIWPVKEGNKDEGTTVETQKQVNIGGRSWGAVMSKMSE
jgi:hypothetical protein